MADTRVVLHLRDWSNALAFGPAIPESIHGVTLGAYVGSGCTNVIGAGQPETIGLVIGSCFLSSTTTTTVKTTNCTPTVTPSPVDPPVTTIISTGVGPYGRDYMNLNLRMIRRDDYAFNVAVTLNGAALDLTGADLRFTAKWNIRDNDAAAPIALQSNVNNGIVITNALQGLATVTIPSSATASFPSHRQDLPYDIQLYDRNGKTYTIMYGTLTVLPDITATAN